MLGKSNPRLLHWIGSVDYSGYVREQCLKYLIDNYQLGDENRILLRLEDWVEPIQQLALQWTRNNFCNISLAQINLNYRLILYLDRKQRLGCREAMEIINSCLIEKVRPIEAKEFYKLDSNFRSYLYHLSFWRSRVLRPLLIKDSDPNNRLILINLIGIDKLSEVELESLFYDKCASVKKRLLYARLEQGIEPSQIELIRLALDKNKGVRELAAYYLAKLYRVDVYRIYRQRTDAKFYYIADFAKKEDLNYFLAGIELDNKRIKLLCFKALCQIEPNYAKQFDLEQLILENKCELKNSSNPLSLFPFPLSPFPYITYKRCI